MMIHKGERPFECSICKKKFREKSNFNYHMKKHTIKTEKNSKKNRKTNGTELLFNINDLVTEKNVNNCCIKDFPLKDNIISNNITQNNSYEKSINNSDNVNILFENESISEEVNKKEEAVFKYTDYNPKKYKNNNKDNINIFNNDNIINNLKNKEIKLTTFENDIYSFNDKNEDKRKPVEDNELFNKSFFQKENILLNERKELFDVPYYKQIYYKNLDEVNSNNNNINYDEFDIKKIFNLNEFDLFLSDNCTNTGNNKIDEDLFSNLDNIIF